MNIVYGLIIAVSVAWNGVFSLECYRCNSSSHRECLEKFIRPTTLRPESCRDVSGARYCIKTTGIYNDVVGDRRFCSAQDLGNYCEFIRLEEVDKEYRSCVYTCDSDACNAASSPSLRLLTGTAAPLLAAILLRTLFELRHAD